MRVFFLTEERWKRLQHILDMAEEHLPGESATSAASINKVVKNNLTIILKQSLLN